MAKVSKLLVLMDQHAPIPEGLPIQADLIGARTGIAVDCGSCH